MLQGTALYRGVGSIKKLGGGFEWHFSKEKAPEKFFRKCWRHNFSKNNKIFPDIPKYKNKCNHKSKAIEAQMQSERHFSRCQKGTLPPEKGHDAKRRLGTAIYTLTLICQFLEHLIKTKRFHTGLLIFNLNLERC